MRAVIIAAVLALAATPVVAQTPETQTPETQTVTQRRDAVQATLDRAPACRDLGDAYWQIGDSSGPLAWGQRGATITASRPLRIASASKWLWAAYVAERRQGKPTPDDVTALTMRSGWIGVNPLRCRGTVADCPGDGRVAAEGGRFHYDSGHAQHQAVTLGLGGLDGPALAAEIRRLIGPELDFTMNSPQPAGGVIMAPAAYGRFLRKLAGGGLTLSAMLGSQAVCTLPGRCATASKSPLDRDWHYSLHHWVEDGPGDDGALSSAGAFGFYPWISADHSLWGLLAREELSPRAGRASALCGGLMRRAWQTARPQLSTNADLPPAGDRPHPVRDALRHWLRDR